MIRVSYGNSGKQSEMIEFTLRSYALVITLLGEIMSISADKGSVVIGSSVLDSQHDLLPGNPKTTDSSLVFRCAPKQ